MTPRPQLVACRTLAVFASVLLAAPPGQTHASDAPPTDDPKVTAIHIGLNGVYKLGCWTPLTVDFNSGRLPAAGVVEVTTLDADGVPASYAEPIETDADQGGAKRFFIRLGQENAPLTVQIVDADGRVRASRNFLPRSDAASGALPIGLPATNRLLVTFGLGRPLDDLARDQQSESTAADALRIVSLEDADDLPTEWFGYEGVDAVILGGARLDAYRGLSSDDPRIAALGRWIELGGQLVIFSGESAPDLIAPGAPLATLVPGKFAGEFAQLTDLAALEVFAGAEQEVTLGVRRLRVPRLVEVAGRVLAPGPADLPLVARQRRGLGEVTFVAVDPEAWPFDNLPGVWPGRAGLFREALQWPSVSSQAAQVRRAASLTGDDLVNQLRRALDRQFAGVTVAPFALVTALVLAYVALIGPGDYFLLKWLKRPQVTWLTFPLAVFASCAAAYWFAYRLKGDELRVNQLEVVDVDLATGEARGTVWTHFLSPRIERYNLALTPRFGNQALAPNPSPLAPPSTLVAWLGSPGFGLGGMRGQRGLVSSFDRGYDFDPQLTTMTGLPVEQWSTKSLTARWTARLDAPLEALLRPQGDDLVAGRITNRTGVRLEDCFLMHGRWARQLPPLEPDATVEVDDALTEVTVRTALTSVTAGDDHTVRATADASVIFDPGGADVARVAKAMMFFEAIGGVDYARIPHRYQAFIDLSRLLRGDQAILLARAPATAGSQWTDGEKPLASNQDRRWTYYRFIIPLTTDDDSKPNAGPLIGPTPRPSP